MYLFQYINNALLPRGMKTSSQTATKIRDAIVECDLISLFADIYTKCFHLDWSASDVRQNKTSLDMVGLALNNATDLSVELCKQVVDSGLYRDILKYLNDPKMHPDRINVTGIPTSLHYLTGILYNVVTVSISVYISFSSIVYCIILVYYVRLVHFEISPCVTRFRVVKTWELYICFRKLQHQTRHTRRQVKTWRQTV